MTVVVEDACLRPVRGMRSRHDHPPSLYGRRPSTFLIWQVTAFRLIDKHGHGYITKKDLHEAFTPEFSKAEIDQMVRSDEIG